MPDKIHIRKDGMELGIIVKLLEDCAMMDAKVLGFKILHRITGPRLPSSIDDPVSHAKTFLATCVSYPISLRDAGLF